MTTTPKPEPASDQEIAKFLDGPHGCSWAQILARIEADRASIREQAEENGRLRSALINLRAKCLEMGWEPRSPQLLDAAAALLKPEPKE